MNYCKVLHILANSTSISYIIFVCIVFDEAGINLSESYISSCGSGTTACWITLAAFVCGKDVPLFGVRTMQDIYKPLCK